LAGDDKIVRYWKRPDRQMKRQSAGISLLNEMAGKSHPAVNANN
jgi:hypothetical protein